MDKEQLRQVFHLVIGLIAIWILATLGRNWLMAATFFTLIIGMLLINQTMLGRKIGLVEIFVRHLERKDVILPGWGSAVYAAGVLILVTALENTPQIAAGIFILAVGDSFSTVVGRKGTHKVPYNKKKTIEGMIAFFVSCLPAYVLIGPLAIPIALVAAIVESLPLPVDDNISIPIVYVLLFLLIG